MKLLSKLLSKKEPKTESEPMEKIRSEKQNHLIVPKMFRRNKNRYIPLNLRDPKKRGDGKFLHQNPYFSFGGNSCISTAALQQINKRRKFKGWQREARRYKKVS